MTALGTFYLPRTLLSTILSPNRVGSKFSPWQPSGIEMSSLGFFKNEFSHAFSALPTGNWGEASETHYPGMAGTPCQGDPRVVAEDFGKQ